MIYDDDTRSCSECDDLQAQGVRTSPRLPMSDPKIRRFYFPAEARYHDFCDLQPHQESFDVADVLQLMRLVSRGL